MELGFEKDILLKKAISEKNEFTILYISLCSLIYTDFMMAMLIGYFMISYAQ